jgi:ketosteroid isomerase-like protein
MIIFVHVSVHANQAQISSVLDKFHQAASEANSQQYFDLLTESAVFIGTDATERWDKPTFKAFAKPYFDKGQGWTYLPRDRHVVISGSGNVAWFDELLDSQSYGECRGTGVLELTAQGWKISQYHLTIPMPNGVAKSLVKQIKDFHQAQ